jgi:hypothetical protein
MDTSIVGAPPISLAILPGTFSDGAGWIIGSGSNLEDAYIATSLVDEIGERPPVSIPTRTVFVLLRAL